MLLLITNLGKGGAQRVFYDHAMAFRHFTNVEEVVFDLEEDQRVYDSGLPLHDLKRNDWLSRLWAPGRLFSRALALRRLVEQSGCDLVISHMDGANWVNVLSMNSAHKILVVHGTVLRDQNIRGIKQWLRLHVIFPWLYNLADRTVAVSDGIARELRLVGRVHNVETIHNFFDLAAIEQQSRLPLPSEFAPIFDVPNVLVTSGRLSEQKKQSHLIDLFVALLKRGVEARLVILGDGELRRSLLHYCAERRLRTFEGWSSPAQHCSSYDVYFLGYVPNPFQFLARSTLFLLPSAWEGFPLALCEAMIVGVPVISADCPTGPREILAPGTLRDTYDLRTAEFTERGVLMPVIERPGDLTVWVETVAQLLTDTESRRHMVARGACAMKAWDRATIVGGWRRLIESACHAN